MFVPEDRYSDSEGNMVGPMRWILEPKKLGNAEIKRVTIPEGTVLQMWDEDIRMNRQELGRPFVSTQLIIDGSLWMTDTPLEVQTALPFILKAKRRGGHILIGGLGLGFVPTHLLEYAKVKSITVVEQSRDVIELVQSQIEHDNLEVIHDDVRNYMEDQAKRENGSRFNSIFIDIWDDMNAPMNEMEEVMSLANKILRPKGFASCWLKEHYDYIRDKIPTNPVLQSKVGFSVSEPCLGCGKTLRADYGGLCMDCADGFALSEMWVSNGSVD